MCHRWLQTGAGVDRGILFRRAFYRGAACPAQTVRAIWICGRPGHGAGWRSVPGIVVYRTGGRDAGAFYEASAVIISFVAAGGKYLESRAQAPGPL